MYMIFVIILYIKKLPLRLIKKYYMKKLIYLFAISVLFASCSKDDDEPKVEEVICVVNDFVGVWKITGGQACILNQTNTLTITDLGNNKIQPLYEGDGVTSSFQPWTIHSCSFTGQVVNGDFININVKGTLKDGKLSISNIGTFLGGPVNCTENLTK